MPNVSQSVASAVLEHSACAQIFQKHRIDFCCRGERSIADAAADRGLDARALVAELNEAIDARETEGADPRTLSNAALVGHIISKHHEYLRKAMPFVLTMSAKVARVHGDHNPRLNDLDGAVRKLVAELEPHLDEEEQTLFPAVLRDDRATAVRELATMHREHLVVGGLLEHIREATEEFTLPPWACNSYRALFAELEALETDVLRHVHLENHVLMPRFAS